MHDKLQERRDAERWAGRRRRRRRRRTSLGSKEDQQERNPEEVKEVQDGKIWDWIADTEEKKEGRRMQKKKKRLWIKKRKKTTKVVKKELRNEACWKEKLQRKIENKGEVQGKET